MTRQQLERLRQAFARLRATVPGDDYVQLSLAEVSLLMDAAETGIAMKPASEPEGRVTLTRAHGQLVAVTRQNDEGRIISVIWQKSDDEAQPASETKGPSGDALSDFSADQWWVKELDEVAAYGTDDQKRAVAVVHNLLATIKAQPVSEPCVCKGDPGECSYNGACMYACGGKPASEPKAEARDFQSRVLPWLIACFGQEIAADRDERNHRFLEESIELVQACGCTASEAHQLVDYVYGRPVGEKDQEVGGVMVTLAALCVANGLDMHEAGERELSRIWTVVEKIRAKQAAKPKHSPLPEAQPASEPLSDARINEMAFQHGLITEGSWSEDAISFGRELLGITAPTVKGCALCWGKARAGAVCDACLDSMSAAPTVKHSA